MSGALANHLATDLYAKKSFFNRAYLLLIYRTCLQKDGIKNAVFTWLLVFITAFSVISLGLIDFVDPDIKGNIIVGSGGISTLLLVSYTIGKSIWASPFLHRLRSLNKTPDYTMHLGASQSLKDDMSALLKTNSFTPKQYLSQWMNYLTSKIPNLNARTKGIEPLLIKPTEDPLLWNRKLVLVIEDLDRCSPDRIMATLEAVRLLVNLDSVIVVFAVDGMQLINAVALKSINGLIDKPEAYANAREYLGKLFQLVIELDEPDARQFKTFIQERLYGSVKDTGPILDAFNATQELRSEVKNSLETYDSEPVWAEDEGEYEDELESELSDEYLVSHEAEAAHFATLSIMFNIANPRTLIRLHNSTTLLKGIYPSLVGSKEALEQQMFYLFATEVYSSSFPSRPSELDTFFDRLESVSQAGATIAKYHREHYSGLLNSTKRQSIVRARKVSIPSVGE